MHASAPTFTTGSIARRLILSSVLVIGLSLALAAAASAQTGFQASVKGVVPKPKPCPSGDSFCGTAITNYGPATWNFLLISDTQVSDACAGYEATVTFVLADGSTLVLDENGMACQPGHALAAPGGAVSYGNPFSFDARWTIQRADGQFESITGAGTDALHAAGAHVTGTYSQTS